MGSLIPDSNVPEASTKNSLEGQKNEF